LQHSDFVYAWRAGAVEVHVERAKALQLINDPAVVPDAARKVHLAWTALWILSVPAALAIMYYYRWWAGVILLVTLTPALGSSTKKAARQLMIDKALADSTFYDYALSSGVIHVREKKPA
jgi:hypothetical protein